MWSGTPQAKASAMRWIENVQANLGGTEMNEALVSTIAISDGGKSDILLITDGEIEGINEVIEVAKKSKHRVFIVAIGASPAEIHLRRLAAETGGHCDFVAPGEDVEPAVLRMSARMHSARANNIRVEWPASLVMRWEQKVQNYAFENDVLNVSAFVQTPTDVAELTTVKLWGCIDGQVGEVLMGEASLNPTESSTNILARLAAYAKYQELMLNGGEQVAASTVATAQSLAVTYKLVTDEPNFILVHERSDEEKAQEMPDAHKVPQMLAAGWGGTGSVVRESRVSVPSQVLYSRSCASVHSAPDYSAMTSPTVWRTNRTQAAARVDALSSGGMDDYEIPAFLRKQADDEGPSLGEIVRTAIDKFNPLLWISKDTSAGLRKRVEKNYGYLGITPAGVDTWLTINHPTLWPKTYAELQDLGLGQAVCEWLEFEIGRDRDESIVVSTFLDVVREFGFAGTVSIKGAVQAVKRAISPSKEMQERGEIAAEIRSALKGTTGKEWSKSVVDYPEGVFA